MAQEEEGVIKFQMEYTQTDALTEADVLALNAWRRIMVMMEMIGQTPDRYDGYGFGNISRRFFQSEGAKGDNCFLITGTQTGGIDHLTAGHYAVINECIGSQNRVVAEGPFKPSSESMTHGILYQLDPDIDWVIHVHDPHIWNVAEALAIPTTHPDVPYGTPEMSAEVEKLFEQGDVKIKKIFSMAGHVDGIFTFGKTAEEAGSVLLNYLAQAIQVRDRIKRKV